jgi:hypothetical protein
MNQCATYFIAYSCISLVLLLQIACQDNSATDEPASISKKSEIDPDKFNIKLTPLHTKDPTYEVSVAPGSSGMSLEEFSVTAYLENNKGVVQGTTGKKEGGRLVYDVDLNSNRSNCLTDLYLKSPVACLGSDNTSFTQGKRISFRIKVTLNATIKKGDPYALIVAIARAAKDGSKSHTETIRTILTATRDGEDPEETMEERSTSDMSTSRRIAHADSLVAVPGNDADIRSAQDTDAFNGTSLDCSDDTSTNSHPSNSDASTITLQDEAQTETIRTALTATQDGEDDEEKSTSDTSTPKRIAHTDALVAVPGNNADIRPAQGTNASNGTPLDRSDGTSTNSHPSNLRALTVMTLGDDTKTGNVRNFVLVTIQPSQRSLVLSDFFVTASLSALSGTIMGGSSRNQKDFIYDKPLTDCSVKDLFLKKANDESFAEGQAITFRIRIIPDANVPPGTMYTLKVTLAQKDNASISTKSIVLTVPPPSPTKAKKRTSLLEQCQPKNLLP